MPGPSNGRKKRKSQGKSQRKRCTLTTHCDRKDASFDVPALHKTSELSASPLLSPLQSSVNFVHPVHAHLTIHGGEGGFELRCEQASAQDENDFSHILLQEPYIHNPGNGPRVRNTRAFLASRYFSQPPALDNPLCAEFAQDEVLQMLRTILPEELALILWYNKSRATSRICPACQRLYHVGDLLPDHAALAGNVNSGQPSQPPPELEREQDISGICSSMCFILASVTQCDPRTTKAAWGHTANEIDDQAWAILNGASSLVKDAQTESEAKALVMLIRMTRLDDLGLAQLCFPDVNWGGVDSSKA
ncbi:hypothetical protein GYMLUDRAFT_36954 [Collybiopsis luxurians FD-317 M1]|nr:hypothetical protein GYMLUDRAFT_36954 [Collybiopsis luxurians FD-317 M1]